MQLIRDVLRLAGRVRLRVLGTSMLPSIWPGDVIEVVAVDPQGVRRGDVLLLERNARFVCHRLVRVSGDGTHCQFYTRGDFLESEDAPFEVDQLIGRVDSLAGSAWATRIPAGLLRAVSRIFPRSVSWLVVCRRRGRN